jgi:hypothetical protein
MTLYNKLVFYVQCLLIKDRSKDKLLSNVLVRISKQKQLCIIATSILLLFSNVIVAQVINLGTAANYVLFTTTGAISNTGVSQITGNVGNTVGAISNFSNTNGVFNNGDAVSFLASSDLLNAYNQLNATVATFYPSPILGYGQKYNAGVYSIPQAATLDDCIILDGQGNSNAVFIFKINGAFSSGASAKVSLINGALACNVFWQVEGAISLATQTFMRGNLIANNGAITLAALDTLEGRALSTTGAISIYGSSAFIPIGCGSAILTGPSAPTLGTTINYALFTSNGQLTDNGLTSIIGDIGTNFGTAAGYNPSNVTGFIHAIPDTSTLVCASDLLNVYNYLQTLPYDIELLYPAQFGNNLVLTPHVYLMNAAAVLTDTVYLNAQGNPNAIFVIKINGALTTSTYAKVKLMNQAQSNNVFWIINGASTINNHATIRGIIICSNGAITLNTGARADGAQFTTFGNITTTSDIIRNLNRASTDIPVANSSNNCKILSIPLPIELLSFTAECYNQNILLKWSSAAETTNNPFSIEETLDGFNWQLVANVEGLVNSTTISNYSFSYNQPSYSRTYFRLNQSGLEEKTIYSKVIFLSCNQADEEFTIFPNPFNFQTTICFSQKQTNTAVRIMDVYGKEIKAFNFTGYKCLLEKGSISAGIYFLHTIDEKKNSCNKKLTIQ